MIEVSDRYTEYGFGKKYPRLYTAESIIDMQQDRANHTRGLRLRTPILPSLNFGSQPSMVIANETKALIILPEMQHYPVRDPKQPEETGMRLTDTSDQEGILVWCHTHSFLDYPYRTCFDDPGLNQSTFFSADRWKDFRAVSWKLPVILLAQYTELTKAELQELTKGGIKLTREEDRPVTEQYWLIHVYDQGTTIKRRQEEKAIVPQRKLVPELSQVIS